MFLHYTWSPSDLSCDNTFSGQVNIISVVITWNSLSYAIRSYWSINTVFAWYELSSRNVLAHCRDYNKEGAFSQLFRKNYFVADELTCDIGSVPSPVIIYCFRTYGTRLLTCFVDNRFLLDSVAHEIPQQANACNIFGNLQKFLKEGHLSLIFYFVHS